MKILIDKEHRHSLEQERETRLIAIVSYAMNGSLKANPVSHAKALHKVVAEYMEICALLENTQEIFHPSIDGYNEL